MEGMYRFMNSQSTNAGVGVASPSADGYIRVMSASRQPMEPWRRNLYILWATQFLAMVGMNLVVPFLPYYIRSLGVTDPTELAHWSGFVFSGPFLLAFFATPIWGNLGDRYGRKMMVVRAIFGLAISQILMGFSQDVYQLFAFRVIQGAISGFIASALALVSTNTPREKIGYALGLMQSATAGGMVLGPFVGGLLADFMGYRMIFFVTGTFCALGGIVVTTYVRELNKGSGMGKKFTIRQNFALMWSDKRLRVVALTLIVGQISVLMIEPIFALYIERFTSSSTRFVSTLAGGIFSIMGLFMVISAPWWGKRNDRLGYKKNLVIALAVVGVVYAGHIVVQDLFQLAILRAFLGFARGGVLPALYSLTSFYAPPERRGGIIAIAASMTILGNMLGPSLGGTIAGWYGMTTSFVVTSLLLLATSFAVWKYLVEPPRIATPTPRVEEETI
jgi:DHA1 family multidrug resistance protein-like MFS transporter